MGGSVGGNKSNGQRCSRLFQFSHRRIVLIRGVTYYLSCQYHFAKPCVRVHASSVQHCIQRLGTYKVYIVATGRAVTSERQPGAGSAPKIGLRTTLILAR